MTGPARTGHKALGSHQLNLNDRNNNAKSRWTTATG